MNGNPLEMLKAIKNPQQFAMNLLTKNNNPIMSNLQKMANEGNQEGIEQFARNLFKQQNRDFDKEFQEFMNLMK